MTKLERRNHLIFPSGVIACWFYGRYTYLHLCAVLLFPALLCDLFSVEDTQKKEKDIKRERETAEFPQDCVHTSAPISRRGVGPTCRRCTSNPPCCAWPAYCPQSRSCQTVSRTGAGSSPGLWACTKNTDRKHAKAYVLKVSTDMSHQHNPAGAFWPPLVATMGN